MFQSFRRKDSPVSRSRRTRIALASACACCLLGSTALGANTGINVGTNGGADKTLSPNNGSATINLGDTITWTWVGPASDVDHVMESDPGQAESWDSDPGAGTNPNHSVGDTFVHQFTHTGAFNYHCRVHPDKMRGVITVKGPPTASFAIAPASGAIVGQMVNFDGFASSDPDGPLMSYEWDLDGNGSFETSGATPSRAYGTAGTIDVKLRVTDTDMNTHTAAKTLTIANPPVVPPVVNPFVPPVVVTAPPAIAKLTFTGAAKQRSAHTKGVTVMAKCDLACKVTATGWIGLPGGKKAALVKLTKALSPGAPTKVVLLVPKASRTIVQKLLAKGKVLTASLVLQTADGPKVSKTFKLTR
jgi:plastocyanin